MTEKETSIALNANNNNDFCDGIDTIYCVHDLMKFFGCLNYNLKDDNDFIIVRGFGLKVFVSYTEKTKKTTDISYIEKQGR